MDTTPSASGNSHREGGGVTDGSTVYHRTVHGDTSQLAQGKLIERVAVL